MPDIILPDGKKISFIKNIDGFQIAKKISSSLGKDACIMSVDGELKDLSFCINKNAKVKIITQKDKEGLEVIRHDAAHIMAMAVQELFPGTQVTIGPVIENGLLVGSFFLIWRIWITKDLLKTCINCIKKGSYLPIFLFGAAGPVILFSPLGQPTNLGFAVFGSGLCLAAALAKKPA